MTEATVTIYSTRLEIEARTKTLKITKKKHKNEIKKVRQQKNE